MFCDALWNRQAKTAITATSTSPGFSGLQFSAQNNVRPLSTRTEEDALIFMKCRSAGCFGTCNLLAECRHLWIWNLPREKCDYLGFYSPYLSSLATDRLLAISTPFLSSFSADRLIAISTPYFSSFSADWLLAVSTTGTTAAATASNLVFPQRGSTAAEIKVLYAEIP